MTKTTPTQSEEDLLGIHLCFLQETLRTMRKQGSGNASLYISPVGPEIVLRLDCIPEYIFYRHQLYPVSTSALHAPRWPQPELLSLSWEPASRAPVWLTWYVQRLPHQRPEDVINNPWLVVETRKTSLHSRQRQSAAATSIQRLAESPSSRAQR